MIGKHIVEEVIQSLDEAEQQGFSVWTIASVGLLNRSLLVGVTGLSEEAIKAQAMSKDARDVLIQGLRGSKGAMEVGFIHHKAPDQKASVSVFLRGYVVPRGGQIDAIFESPTETYDAKHFLLFGPSNRKRYKGDLARDGRRRMRQSEKEFEDAEALIVLTRLALGLE